ncbi:hypothetical protein EDB92DRAFT_1968768 [Lactarius akahatsu]|uniref:DUF6830 domain-containing protein n=1 Tax=Lactarius akahatsu TaxID=416441 RepID=A0AAD4LJM1_9AGAM|nr:hypothetical protein EDB92DRAFT_1968768 [Lactarius akahatsu]
MFCPHCHHKFRNGKALLCHMNHPFGSCHSHFQEVVNLTDELQEYQERQCQHQHIPIPTTSSPEPMDIDIKATAVEDFQEDVPNVDGRPFIQEYMGAAREYGRGTTFMQGFDRDHPYPMKKDVALFYHDPLECIQSILSNPLVNDYIRFTPFCVYESAVSAMQIYTEWLSGDVAWSMQSQLLDGATLLGVVLSSDKMNISAMTGGHMAHPLLMSLANLLMDFRMKGTNHAFLLLALLPIPNSFTMTQKPVASWRIAWSTNVAEAVVLASVGGKTSHVMMASHKQFGDPFQHEPQTASTTLAQLHTLEAKVNPWHLKVYIKEAKKFRLNGVHQPFWRDWPLSEPSKFLTPEPLHHWHKMFWDHNAKWLLTVLRGRIQRYLMAVITDADAVPNDFLIAVCLLMDFQYLAQAPEISEQDCISIDNALQGFHDHKSSIISAGAQTGKSKKKKKVIDNWYIPKLKLMQSVSSSIRESRVAIQWTADTTERCHVTKIKVPSRSSKKLGYESQICRYLDRKEKCRQFDLATSICEAKIDFRLLPNSVNCEYPGDGDGDLDGLSENLEGPEEPLHINAMEGLLTHIQPVAPVSRTIQRHTNYFELASSLKQGLYPRAPLPFRTVMYGNTALHLNQDPAMKAMSVKDAMAMFNLPDLWGALADFLVRADAGDPIRIGGHRVADSDSPLPFRNLQVWTRVQLQHHSYYAPNRILPPQTINASLPSGLWPCGHSDVVLFNTDHNKAFLPSSSANLFLSYVQQFDIVPQPNPIAPAPSNQRGVYPHPSTGMYLLKRAQWNGRAIMGDVVPLAQLRALVNLVPRFGEEANKQLAKEMALEYSSEFWLNKYFDKELFYALK